MIFLTHLVIRFFLGKHTFAQIALGRKPEEEFKDNLHNVSKVRLMTVEPQLNLVDFPDYYR